MKVEIPESPEPMSDEGDFDDNAITKMMAKNLIGMVGQDNGAVGAQEVDD